MRKHGNDWPEASIACYTNNVGFRKSIEPVQLSAICELLALTLPTSGATLRPRNPAHGCNV